MKLNPWNNPFWSEYNECAPSEQTSVPIATSTIRRRSFCVDVIENINNLSNLELKRYVFSLSFSSAGFSTRPKCIQNIIDKYTRRGSVRRVFVYRISVLNVSYEMKFDLSELNCIRLDESRPHHSYCPCGWASCAHTHKER